MADAFRVADHLTAVDLRQINLAEWNEGPDSYFGSTPEWALTASEVLRGIARPQDDEMDAVIREVPPYPTTPEGIRSAWAHHMAVHSGYHAWPNANHRTAMRSFNLALGRAENLYVGFAELSTGAELVAASKAQRDRDEGMYALDELEGADHRYRSLFRSFMDRLVIVAADQTSQLAKFGGD